MDADRAKQLTKLAKKKHLRDIETIYVDDLNAMERELDDKIDEAAKSGSSKLLVSSTELIDSHLRTKEEQSIELTLWVKKLCEHYKTCGFIANGDSVCLTIEWPDN